MIAYLEFDLSNEEDKEQYEVMSKGQDWKDAFQGLFKHVRDTEKYRDGELHQEYMKALADIRAAAVRLAVDNNVEVW